MSACSFHGNMKKVEEFVQKMSNSTQEEQEYLNEAIMAPSVIYIRI